MKKPNAKPAKRKKAARKKAPKKKMGRPPLTWTRKQLAKVEELAAINCTQREIADYLGVSERTIWDRINSEEDQDFLRYYKKGRARWLVELRQAQRDIALGRPANKGQATMLIWLGKQELGQKDQPEPEIQTDEDWERVTSSTDGSIIVLQPGASLIGSGYVAQVDRS